MSQDDTKSHTTQKINTHNGPLKCTTDMKSSYTLSLWAQEKDNSVTGHDNHYIIG